MINPISKVGIECCLDANDNGICDKDETQTEKTEEISCNIIEKPNVELVCRSKLRNTYENCTLYINPKKGFEKEEGVNYLVYESLSGSNKRTQVPSNYQIPLDADKTPDMPVEFDEYNYYFRWIVPNEDSDMFIIIPYIPLNEELCENLKVNVFFTDAKVLE